MNETAGTQRAYTVKELDELRRACENRWLFGTSVLSISRVSRQYQEADKAKSVEELVRTHMLAGHTAQDLIAADCEGEPNAES